ncbi:sulfatase-like hydrolase/transferase [Rhizobium sp. AAP43]|uniref:sulfatase-like hydrolase/transferase n=1 Tax=Rhizobium sp. AAP43 TaxID=1523420 RepID=UPI0006B8D349|nr:sulfatase-like hydrolase/transferase [Rhizobium sp. AAP43]KPF46841.1 hypothetical protein IP76_02900 [Rhizobium sp. AAP43]
MLLAISAIVLIVSVIFIYSPASVYFGSDEIDFPLSLLDYIAPLLAVSLIITCVVALFSLFLPARGRKWLAYILSLAAIMACAEVFVLMPDFGTFTGAQVNLAISPARYAFEVCAFVIAAVVLRNWVKAPKVGSLFFLLIAGVIAIPALWSAAMETKLTPQVADENALFDMGEANLIVVLLDGFPSDVFEEIIEANGDWMRHLSGFTYYPDMVGVSRTTFLALPSIHSGRVYSPGTAVQPFFREAIEQHSFMSELASAGYSSLLVNPINGACPRRTMCLGGGMILNDHTLMRKTGIARLLGLSFFKAAPLLLKEFAYDEGRWLFPRYVADARLSDHNVEGRALLKLFADNLNPNGGQPTARFLHIFSPHLPVVFGEECGYSTEPLAVTREAFVTQAECALSAFGALITALKQQQLYDKTAIILLSDHGQDLPNRKADGDGGWVKLSGSANSLLVVKPIGAQGEMQFSSERRWLPEVPSIVCAITRACQPSLATAGEKRLYNYYEWTNDYWQTEYLPVTQYRLSGAPWKAESWEVVTGQ